MSLTIKQFSVLNETTGQRAISGRMTNSQLTVIGTQNDAMTLLVPDTNVPGTPAAITSGPLFGIGHMSLSYIKLTADFLVNPSVNQLCIFGNKIRITFLGGSTSAQDSLIYGFANHLHTSVSEITFNVAIANSNSQSIGDYFDIEFPDMTSYPNIYFVIFVLNGAWDTRTVVSTNICSVSSASSLNYCTEPSQSTHDAPNSHFIFINGINTNYGLCTRISVGCYDKLFATEPQTYDYSSLKFSVSSSYFSDLFLNENGYTQPTCYCAGTQILCCVDGTDIYIPIEKIERGMLIKTRENGYKAALAVIKDSVVNNRNVHVPHKQVWNIYKYSKDKNPDLTDDLYVTGGHSILVDELSEAEQDAAKKYMGGVFKIGNKFRLLSSTTDLFEPVNDNSRYTIYQLTMGEEDAIYANGILTESCNYNFCRNTIERQELRNKNKTTG
jgi:hypothetical protein